MVVTAAATIPSSPDRAVISFSIHGEGPTSDEAVRAMVTKREVIEKGLAGISAQPDIRAAQVGITEVRSPDCNRTGYGNPRLSTGACAIIGYTADVQVEVRTAAVNEAGTMVSLAGRLGATNPRVDRFFLAEDKEVRRRGVAQALAEAKLQAEAIALASGIKLGGVLNVSNLSFNGPGPYDNVVVTTQRVSAPPPPPPVAIGLKPRSIETQVRVQVTYAIQSGTKGQGMRNRCFRLPAGAAKRKPQLLPRRTGWAGSACLLSSPKRPAMRYPIARAASLRRCDRARCVRSGSGGRSREAGTSAGAALRYEEGSTQPPLPVALCHFYLAAECAFSNWRQQVVVITVPSHKR
nr:SIMPL domain-containing protein [Sphingomonas parapaucimobilis]